MRILQDVRRRDVGIPPYTAFILIKSGASALYEYPYEPGIRLSGFSVFGEWILTMYTARFIMNLYYIIS